MSNIKDATFCIKGGDLGFSNRQRDIFEKLNAAEKEKNDRQTCNDAMDVSDGHVSQKRKNIIEVAVAVVRPAKRQRLEMKQFRGKESIFKRPDMLPPRFKARDIPDYQRHPHKWVKYSLGDVSQEDMSERTNTAAALAFLQEVEARKSSEVMEEDDTSSHIIFKAQNKVNGMYEQDQGCRIITTDPVDEKPSFRSSKLIMPEYVVGKHKKKEKKGKSKAPKCNRSKEIKLLHLMDEEEFE